MEDLEMAGTFLEGLLIKQAAEIGRLAGKAARKFVNFWETPKEFERDWKWVRLIVPLQARLLVEQVLWDKRGGWRDLVTGFGPVRGRSR